MSEDTKFLEEEYKYNFKTDAKTVFSTGVGLNEQVVREISKIKGEPEWMLEYRLKSLKTFEKFPLPNYGPDLSFLDFGSYHYYTRVADAESTKWEDVPEAVKNTFEKLGIPEAEQKYLSGATTQFESEVVYHNMLKEAEEKGVIFLSADMGLKLYPELFKKYFGTVVPKLDKPLQSYFRINNEKSGQFERSLIICDEGSSINYVEGCTAPIYSKESLHAAVVEIIVLKGARCRYTTVQNWSNNIVNMVTQRALVMDDGLMEWVDGNIGSLRNMKYPACILQGDGAKGTVISIAVGGRNQFQDNGSRMIHIGKNTSSNIISKSVCSHGGVANYRGTVRMHEGAENALTTVAQSVCMKVRKTPTHISNVTPSFLIVNPVPTPIQRMKS